MKRDLDNLLEMVFDEKSFLNFVQALGEDFHEEKQIVKDSPSLPYSNGQLGWENGSIDTMLDAAAAWGNSTLMNPSNNTFSKNPWYRCAHILYAGKFYE
ncbi:hypothetical protein [Paraglaciecola sp. 25GB23A]|uniref:DUF7660 family protein n=1 Tax=Paraglaciecola sp. 25GB23A TaxID=3156068 RepID=UPI0032AF433A